MDTPTWLAPRLAPDERVRYVHEPDDEGWRAAAVSIALAAYLTFVVGFSASEYAWWRYVPGVRDLGSSVPPVVASVVGIVGFGADAVQKVLRHRFTGYAVTDQRLHRVGLLSWMRSDAWPLADVRLVEHERRRRRRGDRVRLEVRDGRSGKRRARFRLRVRDGDALRAALGGDAADAGPRDA